MRVSARVEWPHHPQGNRHGLRGRPWANRTVGTGPVDPEISGPVGRSLAKTGLEGLASQKVYFRSFSFLVSAW